ncbi:antitoxin VbhA family protein [Kitasatospora sp. NPDC088779]|uniref:antitoxin VbhA family protein n=1 Tax=Kitasatospora sp. NPDC088779 TaxID=3154964 RepID=UPI0034275A4F
MHHPVTTPEERRRAVSSATGSVRAEGLTPGADYLTDAEKYAAGEITADELVQRAEARHRTPGSATEQPAP